MPTQRKMYTRNQYPSIVFWLFVSVFFAALPASAHDKNISLCVDDWPPHIVKNHGQGPGPMVTAVEKIFATAGYTTELIWAPWQRCLENVKLGIWDASPGWSKTPAREPHMLFSVPLTSSYHRFMSLKSKRFDWDEWEDLKGLRIGVTNKYAYGEDFEKHQESGLFITETGASDADNLKKLAAGHLDLFVINNNTAWSTAKRHLSKEAVDMLELHPKPVSKNRQSHVVFSKTPDGEEHLKRFNEAVSALDQSGELTPLFEYLRH